MDRPSWYLIAAPAPLPAPPGSSASAASPPLSGAELSDSPSGRSADCGPRLVQPPPTPAPWAAFLRVRVFPPTLFPLAYERVSDGATPLSSLQGSSLQLPACSSRTAPQARQTCHCRHLGASCVTSPSNQVIGQQVGVQTLATWAAEASHKSKKQAEKAKFGAQEGQVSCSRAVHGAVC